VKNKYSSKDTIMTNRTFALQMTYGLCTEFN